MSSRNANLYLQDILQACDDILNFTQTISSAADLQNDRRTFLAVIHSLEIIGEAARQMPKSFRDKHPEFPAGDCKPAECDCTRILWTGCGYYLGRYSDANSRVSRASQADHC